MRAEGQNSCTAQTSWPQGSGGKSWLPGRKALCAFPLKTLCSYIVHVRETSGAVDKGWLSRNHQAYSVDSWPQALHSSVLPLGSCDHSHAQETSFSKNKWHFLPPIEGTAETAVGSDGLWEMPPRCYLRPAWLTYPWVLLEQRVWDRPRSGGNINRVGRLQVNQTTA